MTQYVLAVDQGTTSTRAIIFDHSGSIVAVGQKEHEQIFPRAGWVEHLVLGPPRGKARIGTSDRTAANG